MDWVFDETLKATYTNPVYIEQKKRRNEKIDDSGFVPQHPLDEQPPESTIEDALGKDEFKEDEDIKPMSIEDIFGDDSEDEKLTLKENKLDLEEDKPASIGFKFSSGKSVTVPTSSEEPKEEPNLDISTEVSRPKLKLNIPPVSNDESTVQEKPKIKLKF